MQSLPFIKRLWSRNQAAAAATVRSFRSTLSRRSPRTIDSEGTVSRGLSVVRANRIPTHLFSPDYTCKDTSQEASANHISLYHFHRGPLSSSMSHAEQLTVRKRDMSLYYYATWACTMCVGPSKHEWRKPKPRRPAAPTIHLYKSSLPV